MKNKRRIMSVGLATLILSSTFAFGSVVEIDPILEQAEEFAQTLFETELGKEEQESQELLEILGEEEKDTKGGYIHASYLQGLDGEEDYILAQRENGGYAIFEKESMEVIEYSNLSSAPYQGLLVDRYYAGPANYYEKKDGKIKNVRTGEIFKQAELSKLAKEMKNDLKKNREKRKGKKSEKSVVLSNDVRMSNPGPTGAEVQPVDKYKGEPATYISNYKFFVGNENHGDNIDNSCASVAAQLLLTYHNWASDGRLIPSTTSNPDEKFFLSTRTESSKEAPYSTEMIGTNSTDFGKDSEISFYEKIKDYINPDALCYEDWLLTIPLRGTPNEYKGSKGATILETKDGIRNYLEDYVPDRLSEIDMDCWVDSLQIMQYVLINEIWNEIDNNRPVIAGIKTYEWNKDTQTYKTGGHAIVVYGYRTIQYTINEIEENLNGFIAHYGWKTNTTTHQEFTNVWFNSDWLTDVLTFKLDHTHTAYEEPYSSTNTHVRKCTLCGVTYANAEHTYNGTNAEVLSNNDSKHYTHHLDACSCGYKELQEHTSKGHATYIDSGRKELYDTYHLTHHLEHCEHCNGEMLVKHNYKKAIELAEKSPKYHEAICACGDSKIVSHTFGPWEPSQNPNYHESECACGYVRQETHFFKLNMPTCVNCGGDNPAWANG